MYLLLTLFNLLFGLHKPNMDNHPLPNKYKITTWNQALELIYEHECAFEKPSYILTIRNCVEIYFYDIDSTNTVVMPKYPLELTQNIYPAFIFFDKELLNKCIETQKFPLPDEFVTILDKEAGLLKMPNESFYSYATYLNAHLNINFLDTIDIDKIKKAFYKIRKHETKFDLDKTLLAYSIIVSKYLINTYGGSMYSKQICFGYSPFYEVYTKINNKEFSVYDCIREKGNKSSFDKFYNSLKTKFDNPMDKIIQRLNSSFPF